MDARKVLRWTWLPVGAAFLYAAAVFGMRWQENRAIESEAQREEALENRRIVEQYGDGELKVLMFYANPPKVSPGGKTALCYGVANAKSLRIEPAVPDISPSLSRCVDVRPTKATTYTLVATAASGQETSRELTVAVQ